MDQRLLARYKEFTSISNQMLREEIQYLKEQGGKKYNIVEGKRIEFGKSRIIYSFDTDVELHLPDGTPITVWQSSISYEGTIVCCDAFSIIIQLRKAIGDIVPVAELSAEPWQLISELCKRLDETSDSPNQIAVDLACNGYSSKNTHELMCGQSTAITSALNQQITVIWGPPGTGKTHTLANIAVAHIKLGHRILMVSHSNVSVDGAVLKINEILAKSMPAGTLIRCGYPRNAELVNHPTLTSFNLALSRNPHLLEKRKTLISERKKLNEQSLKNKRYIEIEEELKKIRKLLKEQEDKLVEEAKIVATTISKVTIDKNLHHSQYDVVMFDEASMAYIPQIVFAASLARKCFCCFGDFCQLPPIVQTQSPKAQKWLSTDIFKHIGITDAVEAGEGHSWLVLLDVQRRMHPHISNFVDSHVYKSKLHNHPGMADLRKPITEKIPFTGRAVGFVDLSGMMSVCKQSLDKSRFNILSAFIAVKVALMAGTNVEVGIIAPYNAQARLIHAILKDINGQNDIRPVISCATVHQFQGSEKDIIIFDTVDCYRMPFPGTLLISTDNNIANRLLNVAMTRAKGKFIAVANGAYFKNKINSKTLMLPNMLEYSGRNNGNLRGNELLTTLCKNEDTYLRFYENGAAFSDFLADIDNAKSEITIDIPDSVDNDNKLHSSAELVTKLNAAKKRGLKVIVRAEVKKNLPEVFQALAIENAFVCNPVSIIDKRVLWFGVPPSKAHFVSSGEVLQTLYRPIFRFEGISTSRLVFALAEMDHIIDQQKSVAIGSKENANTNTNFSLYVSSNKVCNICGSPMRLKKGNKFFLGCSKYPICKNTELVNVDFANKYLLKRKCPQDGTSIEASLGPYGIYVHCNALKRHTFKLDEV